MNEYIYFDGMRIARRDAGGNVYYSFGNELGSPTITTATGSTCYDADFYPFGGEHAYTSTCAPNQKFAGMEQDSAAGLYRTIFRQYAANNGRWLSPDPYAGSYDPTNPQSMNRYAYVGNNPMSYSDPAGLVVGGCQGYSTEFGYYLECNAWATPIYSQTVLSTPLSNGPSFEDSYDNGMIGFSGGLGGFGEMGDGHPWGSSGGAGGSNGKAPNKNKQQQSKPKRSYWGCVADHADSSAVEGAYFAVGSTVVASTAAGAVAGSEFGPVGTAVGASGGLAAGVAAVPEAAASGYAAGYTSGGTWGMIACVF
ncbi:MAG: RHS repeat-associated core domain-containing protein [Terracidiphilus sp.]